MVKMQSKTGTKTNPGVVRVDPKIKEMSEEFCGPYPKKYPYLKHMVDSSLLKKIESLREAKKK